jgi:dolichol-phosphate mannosyltransferase
VTASIVLPTYNEAQTIAAAVSSIRSALNREHELIVVDDGDDATADIVRDNWDTDPGVRLIERNGSGLASAVLRGFDAARYDILACMDADLQHPPTALPTLLTALEGGADMALGSRRCATGQVVDDWPLHRRAISHGATALAWLAVPQARVTSDPMTGLFAIRRAVLEPVRDELRPEGYKIALELLARCPIGEVVEVGYTFQQREGGESSLGVRDYLDYCRHLARLTIPARRSSLLVREVPADG